MLVKDYASKEAEKVLADVPPNSAFSMKDGASVKNLQELYAALQNAEQHVFEHHVNEERNDFSSWVKDVHKDYKLANSLSSAKSREECAKAVAGRIYEVQSMIERRKSKAIQETETAAERLEKILSEAAKAKTAEAKKKQEIEQSGPAVSMVVDLETKEEVGVTTELPPGPTAQELLSGSALSVSDGSELTDADESCQKLLEFTEKKPFHKQFGKEMSAVFSGKSMKSFADDMKKVFTSGNAAEKRFLKEVENPKSIRQKAAGKPVQADEKKEKILSHLKRVYE